MSEFFTWLLQPNICYAIDPWPSDMSTQIWDNMTAIIPIFSTPIMAILGILSVALILGVIIRSISK